MSDSIKDQRRGPWKTGTRMLATYGVVLVIILAAAVAKAVISPEARSVAPTPAPEEWAAATQFVQSSGVRYSYNCLVRVSSFGTFPRDRASATALAGLTEDERSHVSFAHSILVSTAFPCTPQVPPLTSTPTPTTTVTDLDALREDDD